MILSQREATLLKVAVLNSYPAGLPERHFIWKYDLIGSCSFHFSPHWTFCFYYSVLRRMWGWILGKKNFIHQASWCGRRSITGSVAHSRGTCQQCVIHFIRDACVQVARGLSSLLGSGCQSCICWLWGRIWAPQICCPSWFSKKGVEVTVVRIWGSEMSGKMIFVLNNLPHLTQPISLAFIFQVTP